MPTPSTARLPLPKSEDEFEDIVRDALSLRFSDPSFKRYGRSGQKQYGIDGLAGEPGPNAGTAWQTTLQALDLLGKLRTDLEKLDSGPLQIRHLLFCVGTPRDARLQDDVAQLSHIRLRHNKCSVEILFWEDLCLDLCGDRKTLEKYYSSLLGFVAAHDRGLMMLGLDILFDADFIAVAGGHWTVRVLRVFRGNMVDIPRYIANFDSLPLDERFVASECIGQGRCLAAAPVLEGDQLSLPLRAYPSRPQ